MNQQEQGAAVVIVGNDVAVMTVVSDNFLLTEDGMAMSTEDMNLLKAES